MARKPRICPAGYTQHIVHHGQNLGSGLLFRTNKDNYNQRQNSKSKTSYVKCTDVGGSKLVLRQSGRDDAEKTLGDRTCGSG